MENWKRTLVNLLGIITTAATLVVIYFVLFMVGAINHVDQKIITEFVIVLVLTTSVKTFWYSSVESTYYSSDEYNQRILETSNAIDNSVKDAVDFETFIKYENINNYNKVVLNKCEGLTVKNYRYRWFDNLERIGRYICGISKPKKHYVIKFIHRMERRAMRIHKLSSASILAFSTTRYGLTDDRNPVKRAKLTYILSGIVISTTLTFVTAMLSFGPNPDTDTKAAVIKFVAYAIQIMYAILQTILSASTTVRRGINTYCNNILTILAKYESYKTTGLIPVIINYEEELENGSALNSTNKTCEEHNHSTSRKC